MSNKKRQRHLDKLARRDAHAKLVAERSGDPRFVQSTRTATGRTVTGTPETMDALRRQRELFIAKFGREPGPNDPVFFDPDADEPTQLWPSAQSEMAAELRQLMIDADIDPAFAEAFAELGYLVTEENRHLFSAEELDAFTETVVRNQR